MMSSPTAISARLAPTSRSIPGKPSIAPPSLRPALFDVAAEPNLEGYMAHVAEQDGRGDEVTACQRDATLDREEPQPDEQRHLAIREELRQPLRRLQMRLLQHVVENAKN